VTLIKEWKGKIRSVLLDVKENFNEWIDAFTLKFMKSLSKIECSKEMADHIDQDHKLGVKLAELNLRQAKILDIFRFA
jgi:hypothetical protein